MNSNSLQQNFILFLEKTKETKEASKSLNGRLCCEKCRFSTKDTALFERHVAQHEEVTFSCTICNHISYSRVESQRHLVKHKGSFPYKCSWCSYGAVRRDYMVKHIQRIHGKSADGIFTIDSSGKIEGGKGLCLPTPRTLGGPSDDVKVVSNSAGKVSNLLSSACQSRLGAPYHDASTICNPPLIRPQPNIVPSTTHTVCKVEQTIMNPSTIAAKGADLILDKAAEYMMKMSEKTSLEETALTSAFPRAHVGMSVERLVQQRPLLQSQVVGITEKTTTESKTMSKLQAALPVANTNHLKTLLSKLHKAPAQSSGTKVISGAVQNISVAHIVQQSVSSSGDSTVPAKRCRQGISLIKHATQEKNTKQKTRPNIIRRSLPPMPAKSSVKPGVQVGLMAPLNQPSQHNRPLMVSGPEERIPPRSNVQVELLAPLNQPIQHNKPLTVSCPEEITIPAGCLVELVEVKNVNGTRELELRLVPQQLPEPQQRDLKDSAVTSTTNRLSFKCNIAADDDQPVNMTYKTNTPKANTIPEPLVQRSHPKKGVSEDKLNVKKENEVTEKAICFRKSETPALGSSSKWFHTVSKPVEMNPSESHKFMQQLCAGQKSGATEPVKPLSRMQCPVESISPHVNNKNSTARSPKYELKAAQPPTNKQEEPELSYEGLPVISSVFSLCPIPKDTPSHVHTKEVEAQVSGVSGSEESLNNTGNPLACRSTLKTEDETRLLTDDIYPAGQLAEKKDEVFEEPKEPARDTVKEKPDTMGEKTIAADERDKIPSKLCKASVEELQTDPASRTNSSSGSKSSHTVQPAETETTSMESERSLLAHGDGHLASNMNPIVSLIRMPSLEFFSLSESANKEKRDGEESITARPVVCCTSNQQNVQERTFKLVLKRKHTETDTAEDERIGLACPDLPPPHKKAKKAKKKKKDKSSKDQPLLGKGMVERMSLTPLKDAQLVKVPGPNQPVVVLNHPNPLVHKANIRDQTLNYQHFRNPTPDLSNQDRTTLSNPVRTSPALKMTLTKIQGQKYRVTNLFLKGVSVKTVL